MSLILKAENISKQYRLGTVGTGTLGDDLKRWWYGVRGKEDPFLQVGAVNDRQSTASEDYVWALKNINFEVNQGEVLGIIGKNGAGKSTLLKLLSRVTSPTTGSIKTRGRIASLLEIGTGFHPELTGRENIFMNGAVLGMTRAEIKKKLDEIIAFSGCEKYIDTPVKRYSSGMTVRLGFAVAAHLEPEILVVDEVLAVGDAEFQKKAIGKMQDLSTGEGRTVLFVSHNMASIQSLCTRAILLENGSVVYEGKPHDTIENYLSRNNEIQDISSRKRKGNGLVRVEKIEIKDRLNKNVLEVYSGQSLKVLLFYRKYADNYSIDNLIPSIKISNSAGIDILIHHSRLNGIKYNNLPNDGVFCLQIPKLPLPAAMYKLSYTLISHDEYVDGIDSALSFQVIEGDFYGVGEVPPASNTQFLLEAYWDSSIQNNINK